MKANLKFVLLSLAIVILPCMWYLKIPGIPFGNTVSVHKENKQDTVALDQVVRNPFVPKKVFFAGEEVPIWIPEVKERLENELIINSHWHSNTMTLMKLAPRWFPLFESIFDSMGVPGDFKYVSLIESRLQLEESPVGAAGLWHLMPISAKEYGLYMDDEVDERYDPVKSTKVAGRYILKAKDKFRSWTNAAASYNRGMSGFARAIEHQRVNNYYDLKMNSETARYVFRIIAVKMIFENPKRYGFYLEPEDYYKPWDTKTIIVDSTVNDWADFALEHGTIYKYVRLYNPWIQEKHLKNKKRRTYKVLIPNKTFSYSEPLKDSDINIVDSLMESGDELDKQE